MKKISEETRAKLRKNNARYWKGKKFSNSHREKLSIASTGRIQTNETRKKIGIASSNVSTETKEKRKITRNRNGKKDSDETRERKRVAATGRKHTEKTKKKLRKIHTGKTLSKETIRKIREKRSHQIFPNKDSEPEIKLQDKLTNLHINYTKHKAISGQPDLFIEPDVCIFVDGDFFHANPNDYVEKGRLRYGYADNKIVWKKHGIVYAKDIRKKDCKITKSLESNGYKVLRFWTSEIENNFEYVIQTILKEIKNAK